MRFKNFIQVETWNPVRIGGLTQEVTISSVKLKIVRDSESGEIAVRWIQNGRTDDAKTYYTDDLNDALGTMNAIAQQLANQTPNNP